MGSDSSSLGLAFVLWLCSLHHPGVRPSGVAAARAWRDRHRRGDRAGGDPTDHLCPADS